MCVHVHTCLCVERLDLSILADFIELDKKKRKEKRNATNSRLVPCKSLLAPFSQHYAIKELNVTIGNP